jgi:hypothetical protein
MPNFGADALKKLPQMRRIEVAALRKPHCDCHHRRKVSLAAYIAYSIVLLASHTIVRAAMNYKMLPPCGPREGRPGEGMLSPSSMVRYSPMKTKP